MNSLMTYGSDDDSNDSADGKFPEMPGRHSVSSSKNYRKPAVHEDNYEEVGMDMSEDSDGSSGPPPKNREEPRHNPNVKADRLNNHSFEKRSDFPPSGHNASYSHQSERKSGSKSPKNKKDEEDRRTNRPEDRNREDRYRSEDKYRRRDERGSRDSRDDDKSRDKSVREDDKGRGRERYRDDRRDSRRYSRDRRDRDRRRSRSRDWRRSKSPRKSSRSPRRSSKSPRRTSKSPKRSRSGSREKGKVFLSRREKADKRMDRLDKLGIQFKPDNYPASAIQEAESKINSSNGGNRFFMPGITGRFREQIEKRKQLWQKAKEQDAAGPSTSSQVAVPAGGSKATKVYEATTFSDDKTSNKFKRLMGIKDTNTESLPVKATDVLKKQQEMFSSMEAQYEVARTATHTMRGVGLGFGSFQR